MYDPTVAHNLNDLDSILEAFEHNDKDAGGADVVEYLPDPRNPAYFRIAVELIRVDLERSWARGRKRLLDTYRDVAPLLFNDPQRLAEIAFEEYRLRRQAGERVTSAEYKLRYSIDTSKWPDADDAAPFGVAAAPSTKRSTERGPAPTSPKVGERFAGFDLTEQLGRGAFGVVFRARQSDLAARDVVLKISAARSVEPQRLARLQHTNIVPLYSLHKQDGLLAICMPFFGRRTLGNVLCHCSTTANSVDLSTVVDHHDKTLPLETTSADVPLPASQRTNHASLASSAAAALNVESILDLLAQLGEALAHAHDRGIVHSDLKPANVLLTDDSVPMLLDFNLASDTSSAQQKATLLVGGTLPYMAPEHLIAIRDGTPVLAASDVYSLGVIAFELLTGRRPYADRAGNFEDLVGELVNDRRQLAPSVSSLNHYCGRCLASIIAHCLEFDLSKRYASARELAEDLRRQQRNLPLRYARNGSLRERGQKWLRRNARGVRFAVAAALVATVVSLSLKYVARQNQLADLEAVQSYNEFESAARSALLDLHAPGNEPELHALGRTTGQHALAQFGLQYAVAGADTKLSRLSPGQQSAARRQGIDLLYVLAWQSARERQYRDALNYNAAASSILSPSTQSKALLDQRATLLRATGDTAAPQTISAGLTQLRSDDHDAYLSATQQLELRQFGPAVAAWQKLSDENRQDPIRWLLLGNAYVGAGRLANAEACYTALIALEPKAMNGYLYRGLCRAESGNYSDAIADYTQANSINPALAVVRINRALAYLALRNYAVAETDATAAIDAGLSDSRAYFVRALIRDALGQHSAAQRDRDHGFAIAPVDDKGWVARGVALVNSDPQGAAEEFRKGAEQFPDSKPLLQNLIHVYGDRLNQPQVALEYANRLLALAPRDVAALASRAVLLARQGDVEQAIADGEIVAANAPAPLTSLQLACVYSLASRHKASEATPALRHLQRALAASPILGKRADDDPDLAAIHDLPEFKALIAAAAKLTDRATSPPNSAAKPNSLPATATNDDAKHSS